MTKPMPFTPWETGLTHEDGQVYYFPTGDDYLDWAEVDQIVADKRLSDAECAAEYWNTAHAVEVNARFGDTLIPLVAQQIQEQKIWYRFAATPHHDEGEYE